MDNALQGGAVSNTADELPQLVNMKIIRKRFVPISERTIYRMISAGEFPRADKAYGAKVRLWKLETIQAWCEASKAAA